MSKNNYSFICSNCEQQAQKWVGKCNQCNMWNSFISKDDYYSKVKKKIDLPVKLSNVTIKKNIKTETKIKEFDRVVDGGLTSGSLTLLCGSPGVGKSTLILEIINSIIKEERILYISGEESKEQILQRANRLNLNLDDLYVSSEKIWEKCLEQIEELRPSFLVIDSIQTIRSSEINGSIGSVSQTKEVTNEIMNHVKGNNLTCLVIGHITKDGSIAGPKVLEHMVDTVLYFEKNDDENTRQLRAIKNRFGTTEEVGLFTMTKHGIKDCKDDGPTPNECYIGQSSGLVRQGNRTSLAITETLINDNKNSSPKRIANGIDSNRLHILMALMTKELKVSFDYKDIFLKLNSLSKKYTSDLDLSLIASMYSSYKGVRLPENTLFVGEVSLNGKIKMTRQLEQKLRHLKGLKYKRVITFKPNESIAKIKDIEIMHIKELKELPSFL